MPLFSESQDKIYADIVTSILEDTNITRSSPGSKTRALAEAVSKKMGKMWRVYDLNVGQAFVDGAKGQYLDFIGDMMGVPRLGEVPATLSSLDRIQKFYVNTGTFGDINGGQSIIIPTGTVLSTGPASTGIRYRVVVNTLLSSTSSVAYVGTQSVNTGLSANVGSRQLIYHNFTDYTDSTNESLKTINEGDITTAQDVESDTNYRFRITNQLLSLEKANSTAIRLAALAVPGVADVLVARFHRGIGTYDIMIKSITPTVSQSLIDAVQLAIDLVTSEGIVGTARAPVEIGLSMVGTLTLRQKISAQQETELIASVTTNVTDYVNSLDIGEDFIVNEVVERVMATSDLIKNVGEANKPLDQVFSYTPSKLEDNKIRATLVGDLSPETDQRIIVENQYAGTTPILFRTTS